MLMIISQGPKTISVSLGVQPCSTLKNFPDLCELVGIRDMKMSRPRINNVLLPFDRCLVTSDLPKEGLGTLGTQAIAVSKVLRQPHYHICI